MKKKYDISIIGAGIIGLSTAYQILKKYPHYKVLVLEKEKEPAMHQTGRNSGVVHTGIYYKPGSLKATNCIHGRKELLQFCDEQGILYKKKHKLIVATDKKEIPKLLEIYSRGKTSKIPDISILSKEAILEIEPNVNAICALYIPHCHIIDYKCVSCALAKWIEKRGASIIYDEPISEITNTEAIGKNKSYQSTYFINCTGLYSDQFTKKKSSLVDKQILPFRGEYFFINSEKNSIVNGLIYPVPDPKFPFLGVHVTPTISGKLEAGPNAVLSLAREGYSKKDFNWKEIKEILSFPGFWKMSIKHWRSGAYELIRSCSKRVFLKDLQRLVPSLTLSDLQVGGSGIRAQAVSRKGLLLDDFVFVKEKNILHVINAPSPAATASFSIARTLTAMVSS